MIYRDLIYLLKNLQAVFTLPEITTAAYTFSITATLVIKFSTRLELVIQVEKLLDLLILNTGSSIISGRSSSRRWGFVRR
jgi:hypothetical protein